MLNVDEIDKEILMLESKRDTTYSVIERLAPLYIVRDHIIKGDNPQPKIAAFSGNSEFAQTVDGKSISEVYKVFDELMTAVSVFNKSLYRATLEKLSSIQ